MSFAPAVAPGTTTLISFFAGIGLGYPTSAGPVVSEISIRGNSTLPPTLGAEILNPDGLRALRAGGSASVCLRVLSRHAFLPVRDIALTGLESAFSETTNAICADVPCRSLPGGVLAPGARCGLGILFSPGVAGTFDSPVKVNFFNGFENKLTTTTVVGSALRRCDLREQDEFTVINSVAMGQSVLRIPQDARYIETRLKRISVGGYSPELKLNGQSLNIPPETPQPTHTVPLDLPFPLRAGDNQVWGRLQVYYAGTAGAVYNFLKISLSGSYYTYGTCGTYQ